MKKIPDNAKKVFEGIIFDVYHWEQEMFDGSFATFEAIKRVDTNAIVAVLDNKILITKEEQPGKAPFFGLPGGRTERGEEALLAAKRELLEETGYEMKDWSLWFVEDSSKASKIEWNTFYFVARGFDTKTEPNLDPGEKIEVEQITLEQFIERRKEFCGENSDLLSLLEKAANDETEKQKLKALLGITT
jgi:ADP-ribose pyrophosphatase